MSDDTPSPAPGAALPKTDLREPVAVDVVEGKKYFWCSCGLTARQPFCDGAHKGTGLKPLMHVAERSETVYFCGCKATRGKPFCDGSHNDL